MQVFPTNTSFSVPHKDPYLLCLSYSYGKKIVLECKGVALGPICHLNFGLVFINQYFIHYSDYAILSW